ncbi:hypothetical protein M595_3203 [Lyngbya aestuarii BL J]|mgnify:CR=1 FL=1|uniref:Uncharacterized protein n=2 Tax=Lyngbya aestuarii BL J TaxID=1348334 RepID=U7QFU4_9CYAN|nr:hypothetical protein [Lyngbya aestuarii]ERT06824.1 hypothetical protein M595_3203 [Lyngbya aestuarii BL J]
MTQTCFYQTLAATVTGITLSGLGVLNIAPAQAATFRLSWTGQVLGYQAEGLFSYNETQVDESGIVRRDDLESFNIAFYDPEENLIQEFIDNHLTYSGFNFNFDTQTGKILQEGFSDEPNGIDIGEYNPIFEEEENRVAARFDEEGNLVSANGLNFWSAAPAPEGTAIPHVHLTDFGNDFPDLPIGFGRHLDVAFFTRTTAQLLNDPTAGDEFGQRMIATKVPEADSIFGLGIVSLIWYFTRKKTVN